jgi:hypothetical protein
MRAPTIALAAALAAAGCSGTTNQPSPAPPPVTVTVTTPAEPTTWATTSTAAQPRNPVEILRKISGCQIPEGTERGRYDIEGNLGAECRLDPNSPTAAASVSVTTYPGDPRGYLRRPLHNDDGQAWVIGPDFTLQVLMYAGLSIKKIDVAKIASQTGGTVLE